MTKDEKLERIYDILDLLTEAYFRTAHIPFENAYALSIIARAFVENLRGVSGSDKLCSDLHMHPDFVPVIFPGDLTIEKHIAGLVDLHEELRGTSDNRGIIKFVRTGREGSEAGKLEAPPLKLNPSQVH